MPEFHAAEAEHDEWKRKVLAREIVLEDLDVAQVRHLQPSERGHRPPHARAAQAEDGGEGSGARSAREPVRMTTIPVLIAGGGPVGMTLARTLSLVRRALPAGRAQRHDHAASQDGHHQRPLDGAVPPAGRGRQAARRRRAGGEQFRRLLDHLADRPRAASLPLSQRRREARRDPGAQRRHPAARARHAGQPGGDRAGAARRHPERIRWSTRAGAWPSRISSRTRRASPRRCASWRPARPRPCAATFSPAATAAPASCATGSASAWRAAPRSRTAT